MLSPCDQIVESIKVGRKADGNPRNGAPGNDSVPHVIPLFPQRSDRADAGRVSARRLVCNSAAVCRNSVSSSRGVDAVSLHHDSNDGIRQHFLQAWFATVRGHAMLLPP
jgi:hypothetical protein